MLNCGRVAGGLRSGRSSRSFFSARRAALLWRRAWPMACGALMSSSPVLPTVTKRAVATRKRMVRTSTAAGGGNWPSSARPAELPLTGRAAQSRGSVRRSRAARLAPVLACGIDDLRWSGVVRARGAATAGVCVKCCVGSSGAGAPARVWSRRRADLRFTRVVNSRSLPSSVIVSKSYSHHFTQIDTG